MPPTRILFVCLGNICRSPLAEGIARAAAARRGADLTIASAGTGGWHVGEPPDHRMAELARTKGVPIDDLRAAQVGGDDADRFDLFVAMDRSNERDLRRLFAGREDVRIVRLLSYHDGPEEEVPDPYYGGDEGFERVYALVSAGVAGLLDELASG